MQGFQYSAIVHSCTEVYVSWILLILLLLFGSCHLCQDCAFGYLGDSVSGTDYASTGITFSEIRNGSSVNLNNIHLARAIIGQGGWWEIVKMRLKGE